MTTAEVKPPMPIRAFARTGALCMALVLVAAAHAQSDVERSAKAGELSSLKNHRVLHLFGADIKERGFAHGYLLAEDIRDDLDAALKSLPDFTAAKYERRLLPWSKSDFDWDADAVSELDGIFEGMKAKLGASGLQSQSLGRPLTRDDVQAINVLADYFGPACSGFAAWDKRTPDGGVIHGRTLDFPIGPKAVIDQTLIVSDALAARKAWVAVGWPGLIVQYTGMNADGLVVCLHDAENFKAGRTGGHAIARGLLLRRMLESIDPMAADPAAAAAAMAGEKPTACGNLFQLSWPKLAAEKTGTTPSAILEFDPADRNVSIRRMDASGTLVLTNHFRVRSPPEICKRFTHITGGLEAFANSDRKVGLIEARKLMMSAEQPVAAHTVYFFPDKREFSVAMTHQNIMSPSVVPMRYTLEELFALKKP